MAENQLFNISESLREDTSNLFLNQPPQHLGDSCCEEDFDDNDCEAKSLPGEPFINKLQRAYKANNSIPTELLSALSIDGMRHLIEILINDTLTLRSLKDGRKSATSSDSESENYRISNNFSTNSYSKQPTFPVSRPIPREELQIRRNNNISTYQKVDNAIRPQKSISVNPIAAHLPQSENFDQTVLKLYHDITEAKTSKAVLMQIIRLSPSKLKICAQANQILTSINRFKSKFNGLMQESGKVKIISQLVSLCGRKKKICFELNESQMNEVNCILEAFEAKDLKSFREFAYGLMSKHEPSDITAVLVRYACDVEIRVFGETLMQIAYVKQVLENQELIQNEILAQNLSKETNNKMIQTRLKSV